jgi:hypothetical protein
MTSAYLTESDGALNVAARLSIEAQNNFDRNFAATVYRVRFDASTSG